MHALLDALGSPQTQFPVVHVAGSKGKGSCVALLASVLRKHRLHVCCYTSPHFEHVRERIVSSRLGGCLSRSQWDRLVLRHADQIRGVHAQTPLTHFEVVTALAFRHFADVQPDLAVVETGLGGVRDATNVFSEDTLEAALVTALDLEHLQALGGDSIQHVAAAKAGIFKCACA